MHKTLVRAIREGVCVRVCVCVGRERENVCVCVCMCDGGGGVYLRLLAPTTITIHINVVANSQVKRLCALKLNVSTVVAYSPSERQCPRKRLLRTAQSNKTIHLATTAQYHLPVHTAPGL